MITLAILAAIFAGMNIFMFIEWQNAPEGYQDDAGFHIAWRNNSEEAQDVSCVWIAGAVESDLMSRAA